MGGGVSIPFEERLARVAESDVVGSVAYRIQGSGNPIVASPKRLPVRLEARRGSGPGPPVSVRPLGLEAPRQ